MNVGVALLLYLVVVAFALVLVRIGVVADARAADRCLDTCRCGRPCARGWAHRGKHVCRLMVADPRGSR